MKFRDRSDDDLQINLTPLIDVVFLLLIFFMVSTTFSRESQLRIQLPEASAESEAQELDNQLVVEISPQGVYAVRAPGAERAQQLLDRSFASLRRAMTQAAGGRTDLVTVIRADRQTPHEAVIRAMDASRRMGITRITFATEQSADGGEK